MTKKILTDLDATGRTITAGTLTAGGLTSGLMVKTTTGGQLTTLAAGSTGQYLQYDGTWNNPFLLYTSNATKTYDFSVATTAQSMLGTTGSSQGFVLAADTSWEFSFIGNIQASVFGAAQTPSVNITGVTVTLSPTMTFIADWYYGNNTSSFTGTNTPVSTRYTAAMSLGTSGTTGSKYWTVTGSGTIRVTGTGTMRVYPSLALNATNPDNAWNTQAGLVFKLTQIGNGTATTVGTLG